MHNLPLTKRLVNSTHKLPSIVITQPGFTCLKLTIEAPDQCVKYAQS